MQIDMGVIIELQEEIANLPRDTELMTELHTLLAKYMEPYVPMQEGILAHNLEIDAEKVRYASPYAHYQYTGIVYGPNIPIMQDGVIVGWFSPPGMTKYPTGRPLTYSTEHHPLATHHWDAAMMRDKKDEFAADVSTVIIERLRGLHG